MSKIMEGGPPTSPSLRVQVGKSSGEIRRRLRDLGPGKKKKSELSTDSTPEKAEELVKRLSIKKHKNPALTEEENASREIITEKPMKEKLIEELKTNIFIQHIILIPALIILSMLFTGILVWTAFIAAMIFLSVKQVKVAKEKLYEKQKETKNLDVVDSKQDCAWLNQLITKYWITCVPALVAPHIDRVSLLLSSNKPPLWHKLEVGKWTLGKKAPRFYQLYTAKVPDQKYELDLELLFTPDFSLEIKIEPIKHICAKILVTNVSFRGPVRVNFLFKEGEEEGIANISVSFIGVPKIQFSLQPLIPVDILSISAVYEWLESVIQGAIKPKMVWPQKLEFAIGTKELQEESDKETPITDIAVVNIEEGRAAPGYVVLNKLINKIEPAAILQAPHKKEVYLSYEADKNKQPITGIAIISGKHNEAVPEGFQRIEKTFFNESAGLVHSDLNQGLFLCVSRDPALGPPITGLGLYAESTSTFLKENYTTIDVTPSGHSANLRKKVSDERLFLAYRGGSKSHFGFPLLSPVPTQGLLRIHLLQGKRILIADACGTSDPYCVLTVGDPKEKKLPKKQSKIIDRNLDPVWNQVFVFPAKSSDILTINCYDKDVVGKDDFLGKVVLPLDTLVQGKAVEQWFDLELVNTGEIRVKITALNFGLPHDTVPAKLVPIECHQSQSKLPFGRVDSEVIKKEREKAKEKQEAESNIISSKDILKSLTLGGEYIDKSGHMDKLPSKSIMGISGQSWQKRWVILTKHKLTYFRSSNDAPAAPLGSVSLKGGSITFNDSADLILHVETKAKNLNFRVGSKEEFEKWYTAIATSIQVSSVKKTSFPNK